MAPATSGGSPPARRNPGNKQNRTAPNDSSCKVFARLPRVVSRLYGHRSSEAVVSDHHRRLPAVEFNHYGCLAGLHEEIVSHACSYARLTPIPHSDSAERATDGMVTVALAVDLLDSGSWTPSIKLTRYACRIGISLRRVAN
jgi:hypothetical protein